MPSNPSFDAPPDGDDRDLRRRRFLQVGASAVAAGLAGCSTQTDAPLGSEPDDPQSVTDTTTATTETSSGDRAATLRGPWPTAHADAANTGAVSTPGPQGEPSVRWREGVRLETEMVAAAGPDGPVATQRDGIVVAYDHDGDRRWSHSHDDRFVAAPVVADDGTVVVGTIDGTVTAYAADGTRRWRRETREGLFASHLNDATPFAIADDLVVLAHPRGEAFGFDLADGTVRWRTDVPQRSHRPAIADGRAVLTGGRTYGEEESATLALSLDDGEELWRASSEDRISIGAGVHEETVYTGTIDGLVVAREVADGSERWRVQLDGDPWVSTIPVAFADRIWIGTLSSGLYGLTGDGVQAHAEIGRPTTPAVGDGRLYLGGSESDDGAPPGRAFALDPDGTVAWRTRTRGAPRAAVDYRDGTVAFGTEIGVVEQHAAADGGRDWRAFERRETVPSPVVGDGTVYCGSHSDDVRGYRATDGTSHLWTVGYDDETPGTPVVAGDTIVAGSYGGDVAGTPPLQYADPPLDRLTRTPTETGGTEVHVDAPSPEPRWRETLAGPIEDVGYGTDRAYLGAGDAVVALTVEGDVRWEAAVEGPVRAAPAVGDGAVYASREDGVVLGLSAANGDESWRADVGAAATAPVLVASGEPSLLVVGTESAVVGLDATDGSERWRTETSRVRGAPAVADGVAVAGDEAGTIRGLALEDGTERWRYDAGGAIHGAPAIAEDTAYVGARDSRLYAVSIDDGSVTWTLDLPDWVDGSPAVAYGAVIVVDQSGFVSAIVGDGSENRTK